MLVSPTVWEDLAKTLLTTNTTWAMTKSMVARLVTLGDAAPDGGSHVFPEPERIAALDPETLNPHVRAGYRGAYLHELAARIAVRRAGRRSVARPGAAVADVYKALKRIKGFGDYAAGAMMRLLGRFDQLGLDSVCRTMYAQRYNGGSPAADREIAAYYEPFGIWRGLVVWMDVMREEIADGGGERTGVGQSEKIRASETRPYRVSVPVQSTSNIVTRAGARRDLPFLSVVLYSPKCFR